MRQQIKAGAEIDFLTPEEFSASHAELIKAILRQSKKPSVRTLDVAVGTSDGAGLVVLTTKAPPVGRAWEVRRITVSGAPRTTTTLSTGLFLYRGTESPASFLDFTTQIPRVGVWEEDQLLLYPGDTVIGVVVGGPVTTQLALVLQGIDHSQTELRQHTS